MADDGTQGPGISRRGVMVGSGLAAFAGLSATGWTPALASDPAQMNDDAMLAEFDTLLQKIREAARLAFARSSAHQPLARATGLMHIINNLALGTDFAYRMTDPRHPELFRYMGPDRKQGGDNQDARYSGFAVDAAHTYRLHGNRGSARYFSITTVERSPTPWGGGMGGALFGRDLKTDTNGNFEVILSAKPHPGNWVPLTEKDFRITIREFFADWENEQPMRAQVELVGESFPPQVRTSEEIMQGLRETGDWIVNTIRFWQDVMDLYRKTPNQFISWRKATGDKVNATPGGDPSICLWQVPQDKALILRVRPPKCEFWNIEFNNPWWETMDYVHRLSGTNIHHAVLEDDGEVIAVIAHKDPGVPNWLDTSGFLEGMVGRRWMFADSNPDIQCQLVPHNDLFRHLPKNVKRITPTDRQEQLKARRRGIYNRFGLI